MDKSPKELSRGLASEQLLSMMRRDEGFDELFHRLDSGGRRRAIRLLRTIQADLTDQIDDINKAINQFDINDDNSS